MEEKCLICKNSLNNTPFRICMTCMEKEFPTLVEIASFVKDEPISLWDIIAKFYGKRLYWLSLFFTSKTKKELKDARKNRKKAKDRKDYFCSEDWKMIQEWITRKSEEIRNENI